MQTLSKDALQLKKNCQSILGLSSNLQSTLSLSKNPTKAQTNITNQEKIAHDENEEKNQTTLDLDPEGAKVHNKPAIEKEPEESPKSNKSIDQKDHHLPKKIEEGHQDISINNINESKNSNEKIGLLVSEIIQKGSEDKNEGKGFGQELKEL